MFTNIYLENFKSFRKINFNLLNKANDPKKLIVIYGENGSGKSNIVSSFAFLKDSLISFRGTMIKDMILNQNYNLNDSKELMSELLKVEESHINWFDKYRRIGTAYDEVSTVEYELLINGKKGLYRISFDSFEILEESFYYAIEERSVQIFKIVQGSSPEVKQYITDNKEFYNELSKNIRMYWGKHTFFSILLRECIEKSSQFTICSLNENFKKCFFFFMRFACKINGVDYDLTDFIHSDVFFSNPRIGVIDISKQKTLEKASLIIRDFLKSFDKNIIDAFYKMTNLGGKIGYNLFIRKNLNSQIIDIDSQFESNGTKSLIDILFLLLESSNGNTVILDECDSTIHDLLFREVIENLFHSISGQLIITTHNTYLLDIEEVAKKSAYVIWSDEIGSFINPLGKNGVRLYKDNNYRKKYLEGEYKGVPNYLENDFSKLSQQASELNMVYYSNDKQL